MNRTASFWQHVNGQATRTKGLVKAAALGGPKIDQLNQLLDEVAQLCQTKAMEQASAGNVSAADGIIVIDDTPTAPVKTRTARPAPSGSFQTGGDRTRTVKYLGESFSADNMAIAIVHMFDKHHKWANGTAISTKEINLETFAAAIKTAWPENTYGVHRVDYDLKKYLSRKFTCQRRSQ